jgi:hypothetical protein
MKKLVVSFLLSCATAANADVLPLQMQYSAPAGFSSQWTAGLKTGGCLQPGQCFTIPTGKTILGCTGTQTVKMNGLELLAAIFVGNPAGTFEQIWVGHQLWQPTVQIQTPPMPNDSVLVGNGTNKIWIEYQLDNNSGQASPPGGGWEMQATCTAGSGETVITVTQ